MALEQWLYMLALKIKFGIESKTRTEKRDTGIETRVLNEAILALKQVLALKKLHWKIKYKH